MKSDINFENINEKQKDSVFILTQYSQHKNKDDEETQCFEDNIQLLAEGASSSTLPVFTQNLGHQIYSVEDTGQHHQISVTARMRIIKELLKITCPLIIVGVINSSETFIRLKLISSLGSNVLAANSLSLIALNLLTTDNGFLSPIFGMLAQSFGEGISNQEEIGQIVKSGWIFAAILSTPTMIGSWFAGDILKVLGQSTEVISILEPYTKIVCFSIPAMYGIFIDTIFLQSTSNVYNLIPLNIIYFGLGVGISYALVLGKLGCPSLGFIGSSYATLIQAWLCWFVLKIYFLTKNFKSYNLFDLRLKNFSYLKKMLKLGIPLFLLNLERQLVNFIIGIMIGWLGTKKLAINQITESYLSIMAPLILGIIQGTQIKVSQFKGAKDYTNMKHFGDTGIILEAIISMIPLVIYSAIPISLAGFFMSKEELRDFETFTRMVFITKALSGFVKAIQSQLVQNLSGLLDTWIPSVIQILTDLSIALPLSYIISFYLKLDLVGINISNILGLSISTIFLLRRWYNFSRNEEILGTNILVRSESVSEPNSPAREDRTVLISFNNAISSSIYNQNNYARDTEDFLYDCFKKKCQIS